MALSNYERVTKVLDLLRAGLAPFVTRELRSVFKDQAEARAARMMGEDLMLAGKTLEQWDAAALIKLMWEAWNEVFRNTLGYAERSLVSELRDVRILRARGGARCAL